MHFISPVFDLYSDYLLVNQGQSTATGLSALVDGKLSHDAITRSLHQQEYGSCQLWQVVRPFVEQIANPNAVLTLDDTVEAKPYMGTNPLIRFHYDHCQKVALKGINQLTALYTALTVSLPVAYKLIEKDQLLVNPKTNKTKWISRVSKQERFRRLITKCLLNRLVFKYILADSCGAARAVLIGRELSLPCRLGSGRGFSIAPNQAGLQRRRHSAADALSGDRTGGPAMT